jgi:hypothetical protein
MRRIQYSPTMRRVLIPVLVLAVVVIVFFTLQILPQQNVREEINETVSYTSPSIEQKRSPSINPDEALITDISGDLATKYKKPRDEVVVTIEKQEPNHATGTVQFTNESGGAVWFAAKENNVWKLAYDGQQAISCTIADQYSFPNTIVEQCMDAKTNTLTDR